ncbi:MAG: histidine phosphatase family protein [Dehalococcoidales bacterium]|nr:histidine phosphatase family protein [Dehalococcoidales bacterium]
MAKLLLVRHGTTKLHQADRFWGSTDVALSDVGIRQAEKLRDRLKKEKLKTVYSSTLSRARLTAEIIASAYNLKVTPAPELNECNFGYVEGLTFAEINKQYPDLAEVLLGFDIDTKFPGGESFAEFDKRVQGFLPRLKDHKSRDTILIVAHGGSLPLIVCHLLGLPITLWRQLRISQASLSIMETYPQGAVLNLLNDTCHLKP